MPYRQNTELYDEVTIYSPQVKLSDRIKRIVEYRYLIMLRPKVQVLRVYLTQNKSAAHSARLHVGFRGFNLGGNNR